jgi:hypothetical protein
VANKIKYLSNKSNVKLNENKTGEKAWVTITGNVNLTSGNNQEQVTPETENRKFFCSFISGDTFTQIHYCSKNISKILIFNKYNFTNKQN